MDNSRMRSNIFASMEPAFLARATSADLVAVGVAYVQGYCKRMQEPKLNAMLKELLAMAEAASVEYRDSMPLCEMCGQPTALHDLKSNRGLCPVCKGELVDDGQW